MRKAKNKQTIICAVCKLLASSYSGSYYAKVTFDDGIIIYFCPSCLRKELEKQKFTQALDETNEVHGEMLKKLAER